MANCGQDVDQLELLVFQLEKLVCRTHDMMMEAQQKLLMGYMQGGVVNLPTLGRKIQLCHNILSYEARDPRNRNSKRYFGLRKYLIESKLQAMAQEHEEGRLDEKKLAKLVCEKKALIMMTSAR